MADTNTYISKQKVEKWTTKEKFNAFDLSDIPVGTEYNLTGQVEESELDSALQAKINGKLTAPTTPTVDSAVTMLADGTVGTKPLSEIGGGGGKLYLHRLSFNAIHPDINSGRDIEILVERYSSNGTPLTSSDFQTLFPVIKVVIGTVKYNNGAICAISCAPTGQILSAVLYYPSNTPDAVANKEGSGLVLGVDLAKITESTNPPAHRISFSSDTVTEL